MDKKQIQENCLLIQQALDNPADSLNITEVQNKLLKLSTLMGLSAEIIKDCRRMVLEKQKYVFAMAGKHNYSPNIFKLFMEGEMSDELSLFMYCERLNAAISHCTDSLRTVISLYKQEMVASVMG